MKILVIVGSSRNDGMSERVYAFIQQHLIGKAQVSKVTLRDYRIELCDADNACQLSPCPVPDDMALIMRRMLAADGLIYMPVMHAYGTNSRFQAFLERAGYGFLRPWDRPLKDKLAAVVVVGRRYGHTSVYSQVVLNILLNKMILVGSGFPPTYFSHLGKDSEAEESLRATIDRMLEHFQRLRGSVATKPSSRTIPITPGSEQPFFVETAESSARSISPLTALASYY